jgi:hypothetical protein
MVAVGVARVGSSKHCHPELVESRGFALVKKGTNWRSLDKLGMTEGFPPPALYDFARSS